MLNWIALKEVDKILETTLGEVQQQHHELQPLK